MKNIIITGGCFVEGKPVEAGEVLKDVDNGVAAELLTSGRAKLYVEPKKAKEEPKPAAKKSARKAAKKNAK
jgi:hypothetical protein